MVSYISELRHVYLFLEEIMCSPRGLLLGILGVGVPPGSPNPDPISDQKKNGNFPHPFSDWTSKILHYQKSATFCAREVFGTRFQIIKMAA